jgi:tetratricopeptide (TPR) repeat protein
MSNYNQSFSPAAVDSFSSFAELHLEHVGLMRANRTPTAQEQQTTRIHQFLRKAQATGSKIEEPAERDAAQSIIDYWTATLVTSSDAAGITPNLIVLADYDDTRADDLATKSSPFKGLSPFGETDASRFFGREEAVKSLLELVARERLIVVVGPSGSGKSSLIFAGLLPRLKAGALPLSEAWHYLPTIVPGADPQSSLLLAACRSSNNIEGWIAKERPKLRKVPSYFRELIHASQSRMEKGSVFLVVDQFEELFTLSTDQEIRMQFVSALSSIIEDPRSQDRVIVVLRDDFLERAKQIPIFTNPKILYRPPCFTSLELRRVIEEPAKNIGLKFEEGIVDNLIKEVIGDPSALPLLQFTLKQLWDHRERNRITWASYQEVGRPYEALKRTAEKLYTNLGSAEDKTTVEAILLALVQQTVGAEFVRRRVRRDTLRTTITPDEVDYVLNRLVEAGLVVRTPAAEEGDDRFKIAHDTLVRNWPRLSEWLRERREKSERKLQLLATAKLWQESGRKSGYLLSGDAITEAEKYAEGAPDLKDLVAASRKRSRRILHLRIYAVCILFLALIAAVSALTYQAHQLRIANRSLTASVDVTKQAITDLVGAVEISAGSISVQDANKLLDSARASIQQLTEKLANHREIDVTLITLLNKVTDGAYKTKDWQKGTETAAAAQERAQLLVDAAPEDPDRLSLLYESTYRLGDALALGKRTNEAEAAYQRSLEIANKLARPQKEAFVELKLGDICVIRKEYDCALSRSKKALMIYQSILTGEAKDDMPKPMVELWIANSQVRIGDALVKQKRLEAAREEYQIALPLQERLAKAYPDDKGHVFESNLARTYDHLASVCKLQRDLPGAKSLYEKSLEMMLRLARLDPSNSAWLETLGNEYVTAGDLLLEIKESTEAIADYRLAERVWGTLKTRFPTNSRWVESWIEAQQKLTVALLAQTRDVVSSERKVELLSSARKELNILQQMIGEVGESALRQRQLAAAYVGLGDGFKEIRNDPMALEQYQEARRVVDNFIKAHPDDPDLPSFNELRQELCSRDPGFCFS